MLESYCGPGSPFWNRTLSWEADVPDLSECFEHTVLVWLPCAFLWLLSPYELLQLSRSVDRLIPWTVLNVTRYVLVCVLIMVQLCSFVNATVRLSRADADVALHSFFTPALLLLTLLVALVLMVLSQRRGRRTSGLLWLFFALHALCSVAEFRSRLLHAPAGQSGDGNVVDFVLYMVYFPLLCAVWLLLCWADAAPQYTADTTLTERASPLRAASFISDLTYAWFEPMAWRGWRHDLTSADLWQLDAANSSRRVVPPFYRRLHRRFTQQRRADANVGFVKSTDNVKFSGVSGGGEAKPVSVLPALVSSFGGYFLFGAALKFVYDLLQFVNPQILSLIVDFVGDSSQPMWRGYLYAGLMVVVSVLMSFVLNRYFLIMMTTGMRLRTALISAIYRKALSISNLARRETTVGEIVNLMSVDTQRFMDLTSYICLLWSAPLQIALAIFFLYRELGPSVFSGLAVMIILMPVNGVIANATKKLQLQQMKYKDQRVKMMNEILNGIKVLKLYAWEPSFEQQVLDIRRKEIGVLRKCAYLNAGTSFIWSCAPFIVTLVTFAVYVLTSGQGSLTAGQAFVAVSLFNVLRVPLTYLPMLIVFTVQVCLASFATFVLSDPVNNVLDSKRAFVSLALFNALRFPLSMLPMIMISVIQANVSLKRINKFLASDDLDPEAVCHDPGKPDAAVLVEDATFSWDPQLPAACLRHVCMHVPRGSLVAVVGTVGCGKSSLLMALLGEMEKVSGSVCVQGSVAYVAQEAWIQNATLKQNIMFGRQPDDARYARCVDACALSSDIAMLPAGDATEIGEKGINLSGGQKQRTALARAVYSERDVYLLDDPLSAVDAHVGQHIFDNVIGPRGLLRDKTRILVTHSVAYLPQTDLILVLKDGEISESGTYDQLMASKGAFSDFLLQYITEVEDDPEEAAELDEIKQQLEQSLGHDELVRQLSSRRRHDSSVNDSDSHTAETLTATAPGETVSNASAESLKLVDRSRSPSTLAVPGLEANGSLRRCNSSASRHSRLSGSPCRRRRADTASSSERRHSTNAAASAPTTNNQADGKLVDAEKTETGKVKMAVYWYYMRAVGLAIGIFTFLLYTLAQAFSVGSNVWLARWTDDVSAFNNTAKRDRYLGVYGALGFGQAVAAVVAAFLLYWCLLRGAQLLHDRLLCNVLRLPVAFFEVTPIGRLVNRFGKDVDTLDTTLPMVIRGCCTTVVVVFGTFFAICYSTPVFIAVIVPLLGVYYFIQLVYVATSRQLKRLESVSRSPIYSHFSETITGATTIRAFGKCEDFVLQSEEKVDDNQACYYPSMIANRWLAFRLDMVGSVITFAAAVLVVAARDTIDRGLVGMSVAYAMQVTQTLNWLVRMTSDVETNIVAVERVKEYTQLPQEAAWHVEPPPPADWPQQGRVQFRDYRTRYRPGLPLVLRGITADIAGGEKVGIVGRTGAGKSSLTLALFRIIEASGGGDDDNEDDGGSIMIDGVPLSSVGLHQLRRGITIIPQEPVLFSGSLRRNLDPFSEHSDAAVWSALELCHLKQHVQQHLPDGLLHEISEAGGNLSVGQRQLVCLGRALLRKTRVLVLDEATAAVDLETDELIQRTIRAQFADCTVLTIAHRLHTVIDNDRVMVLSAGKIVEFAAPSQLLADASSIFYGMAKSAGLVQ